jgi:glycosyltransferase involved in cell wall biosynthesis
MSRPLRVVHCPVNTAGIPWQYVQALRRKGVEAQLVVFNRLRLHPEADVSLDRPAGFLARQAVQLLAQAKLLPKADIFHFYFGLTLIPKSIQFLVLRAAGKRSIYHFLGSDIRGRSQTDLAFAARADARVVGNFDDRRWLPDAEVVLPGIDFKDYPLASPSSRSRPLVVHAPSNRSKKGTEDVIRACAELPVDLEIVEGVTHTEARRRYAAADIVIDQLKVGWYGVFAIEAMAMGKPVVCFLHDDALSETEKEFQTTVPIVSATPETLEQKLHPLVDSIELRQSIGASSRKYAEQLHDVDRIADQLIAIYERIA